MSISVTVVGGGEDRGDQPLSKRVGRVARLKGGGTENCGGYWGIVCNEGRDRREEQDGRNTHVRID